MIIFRVDGNSIIGVGHFSRCICIAKKLLILKEKIIFVISPDSSAAILEENNMPFYTMKCSSSEGWSSDEFVIWLENNSISTDVVFLDSYRVTKEDMQKIHGIRKLIYLDDLAMFDYPVDTIINYNIESSIEQYLPTEFPSRTLYLGLKYFPAREEFSFFKKNRVSKKVKRVLITSSSTDPTESILRILNEIKVGDFNEIEFLVLEGIYFNAEYRKKLYMLSELYSNITFLPWGQKMARLISSVDLVICPGSTVMIESFVIGVPCISFSFVDNHLPLCKYCDDNHIAPYIGDYSIEKNTKKVHNIFMKMLVYLERKKYFNLFGSYIDNQGCIRIIDILLGEKSVLNYRK